MRVTALEEAWRPEPFLSGAVSIESTEPGRLSAVSVVVVAKR